MTHVPTKGDIYKRVTSFRGTSVYYRFYGIDAPTFLGGSPKYLFVNTQSGYTASPTNIDDFTFQPPSEFPELYI